MASCLRGGTIQVKRKISKIFSELFMNLLSGGGDPGSPEVSLFESLLSSHPSEFNLVMKFSSRFVNYPGYVNLLDLNPQIFNS